MLLTLLLLVLVLMLELALLLMLVLVAVTGRLVLVAVSDWYTGAVGQCHGQAPAEKSIKIIADSIRSAVLLCVLSPRAFKIRMTVPCTVHPLAFSLTHMYCTSIDSIFILYTFTVSLTVIQRDDGCVED